MSRTRILLSQITGLALVVAASFSPSRAVADDPVLFVPGNTFASDSHYVSGTVFSWYDSVGGQVSGPWRPLEGRVHWTGEPAFWESQIKQMMAANIDVMLVHLIPLDHTHQRGNLFRALSNLRAQGYNVPKVVPFLDTHITSHYGWVDPRPDGTSPNKSVDLATAAGKDAFVNQFVQFYQQYYGVNTDAHADSYLAQIDGHVVLDTWHLNAECGVLNPASMTRSDVQTRLAYALGGSHPLFDQQRPGNGVFMIRPASSSLGFADQKLAQFEVTAYYDIRTLGTRKAVQIKPGYWDENIRNPGTFLKRDGGTHYEAAWNTVQADRHSGLRHVNIESWNEYDEGSGIYAADPGPPYILPGSGNPHTDTWSWTMDPCEYIEATAYGARLFNDTPDRDARILWHNFPTTMSPGQTCHCEVIVRNDGDLSWTGASGLWFGEQDGFLFSPGPYGIDDTTNEIPTYGGVFRGRPIKFNVQITAPAAAGTYTTRWSMWHESAAWFGDVLTVPINVTAREAAVFIFYNNSAWDGGSGLAEEADDGAIAPDKTALRHGQKATLANYTSYDKGINGLMIDVPDLPGTPGVHDFLFRKGNDDRPDGYDLDHPADDWLWAPVPVIVTVRRGAGRSGADRVTLIWQDGAVRNCWLQVTVLATDATGLAENNVFYVGNAVGDSGNSATDTAVNVIDALGVRANPRTLLNPAPIDFRFDYNRDKQVNVQDELIVRANPTTLLTDLNLIDLR